MPRTFSQTANPCSDLVHPPTAIQGKRVLDLPVGLVDEQLMKAAAGLPCIFYESTSDLVVIDTSPNTLELIGIRSENFVGKKAIWQERVPAEDLSRLIARIEQLHLTDFASDVHKITDDRGLPVWVAHSFRKLKSGHDLRIRGCIVPLPSGFNGTALDNNIISQFVHKIGNHFQLMNFLLGALQRSGTNATEIEALQQTVDRAVEFTRAFSHYSQPITGLSKLNLGEVLRSAARSMAPAFEEKNIAVSDVVEPSLSDAFMNGDLFLLELAFRAVLQNAVDATKNGDQIIIRGRSEEDNIKKRSVARIAILDTGCGIEKELQVKAVEAFISSKADRDGLGLSTAVRIVGMHGGALSISSVPGRGTQVEILLPISNEAESD